MNQTVTLSTYGMELLSSDKQVVDLAFVMESLIAEASADGETEATIDGNVVWYPDYHTNRPWPVGVINQ